MSNYYKTLGVPKEASQSAIKAAYRKLALRYHPDKNPDDSAAEESFKSVSEAYAVLGDPAKRASYDRGGTDYRSHDTGDPNDVFRHFNDMFGDMFGFGNADFFGGQRHAKRGPARGSNVNIDISLEFLEAAKGCLKEIEIQRVKRCDTCKGTRCAPGTGTLDCSTCGGNGRVRSRQGLMVIEMTCPVCSGDAKIPESPCIPCRSTGYVECYENVEVRFPAGVITGQKLKLRGMGFPGQPGAPSGDAYVRVFVAPSGVYERHGLDIHTHVEVSVSRACLGGSLVVDTINGQAKVHIPAGTQPGSKYVLDGQGISSGPGTVGNHIINVHVKIPTNLSDEQRDEIIQLEFLSEV